MLKWLVPVDGSEMTQRLAEYLVRSRAHGVVAEIHLLNVQVPVESGHARMFVSAEDLERYYREEAEAAFKPARTVLDAAGIAHRDSVVIGNAARSIADFAAEHRFDAIVMGTHGRSGLSGLLMGSVARDVVRAANVPVTLVKS